MPVYNIRFENQSGTTQKYAFFSSTPRIASNAETTKIYSNVFMSQNVSNNSSWAFSINTQFYAWCGIAPEKLGNGVKVNGSGKPVNLGAPSAPGTTWMMYNNHSSPALKAPTSTAGHGAFEIDTGNDFHPRMDFVLGVGGVDASNRIRAYNTLEAPRNARVNLAPVPRYFLTATELGVGAAVDPCLLMRSAANIDFGSHPGMYGAIVRRVAGGAYTIQYTSGAV